MGWGLTVRGLRESGMSDVVDEDGNTFQFPSLLRSSFDSLQQPQINTYGIYIIVHPDPFQYIRYRPQKFRGEQNHAHTHAGLVT